jgi:1,2-diacylglycerol 3-beta-galactosyltransferase
MVVSLVPNLDRAIYDSLRHALPGVPMVTVLTDIADYPPHFWIERDQDQHFICGSGKAVEQARALGHTPNRIHRVSGMILNPRFYEITPLTAEQRTAERARLGFDPDQPVGLLMFGGEGNNVMVEIARNLDRRQLIAICGKNTGLKTKLDALPHHAKLHVEGFTKEVPRFMQLADYFIGKPGPGSISEAIAMHLPVIVERNAWTLPQERYNADWIREHEVGVVLGNFRGIARAVEEMLQPESFRRYRAATERIQNRAVFEIPVILQRLAGI